MATRTVTEGGFGLPAAEVRHWLREAALPMWLSAGIDRAQGGFEETLALTGAKSPGQIKRVRVQARQIYVMSHAAILGLSPDALEGARFGYAFMTGKAWHPDGGWAHLLTADGAIHDGKRDTYDHAFVLLALGWFYRATGDRSTLDWIARTLDFVDRALADGAGGLHESVPRALPRRQNPHMHFFEAMLSLFETTGERSYLDRAGRIYTLFMERFFDRKAGVLREFFEADWRPRPAPEGDIIEPGHHCEWVWLLDKYERLTATSTGEARKTLLDFALRYGRHPKTGLLVDEILADGRPHKASARSWPQTEGLKAALVTYERGDQGARLLAVHFARGLLDSYLAVTPTGLWQDQFDAEGAPMAKVAPASTLYHVFLAFLELLRVAETEA